MFGGLGIYWRGDDLRHRLSGSALLQGGRQSRGEYLAKGLEPFRPNERQTLKSYYEVPRDVLNDTEAVLSLAREAIRAGKSS